MVRVGNVNTSGRVDESLHGGRTGTRTMLWISAWARVARVEQVWRESDYIDHLRKEYGIIIRDGWDGMRLLGYLLYGRGQELLEAICLEDDNGAEKCLLELKEDLFSRMEIEKVIE